MMQIVIGNILDTPADALLLTIDGAKRGLQGNLARQFEKRWTADWQDMQRDVRYPIPLGRTVSVNWDGDCPWRCVLFASTLNHLDVHTDIEKRAIVVRAFHEALDHCQRLGVKTLSTTVMRGGWRLSLEDAFRSMLDAWVSIHAGVKGPEVRVFVMDPADQASLSQMLSSVEKYSK